MLLPFANSSCSPNKEGKLKGFSAEIGGSELSEVEKNIRRNLQRSVARRLQGLSTALRTKQRVIHLYRGSLSLRSRRLSLSTASSHRAGLHEQPERAERRRSQQRLRVEAKRARRWRGRYCSSQTLDSLLSRLRSYHLILFHQVDGTTTLVDKGFDRKQLQVLEDTEQV